MFIHCLKGRTPFLVGYSPGLRGRFALLFTSGFLLARSLILKVSGRELAGARFVSMFDPLLHLSYSSAKEQRFQFFL